MKYFYLAGAIAQASDAVSWRNAAAGMMLRGCEVLDPLKFEVDYSHPESIVRLDYGLILRSKAVIAFVGEHSWGTAMELAFAKHHRVPVYAFDDGRLAGTRISPWLAYHCNGEIEMRLEDAVWRAMRA